MKMINLNSCVKTHMDKYITDKFITLDDEKINFAMARMGTFKYNYTINTVFDQPMLSNPEYQVCEGELNNLQFRDYKNTQHRFAFEFFIKYSGDYLGCASVAMICSSIQTLKNFIENISQQNRYIFLPCFYKTIIKTVRKCNMAMIYIDRKTCVAYLMDPNGHPPGTSKYNQISFKIENMLEYYFNIVDIKYVSTKIWNKNNIVINKAFSGEPMSGNCLILSILLPYILYSTDKSPSELYDDLADVSNFDLYVAIKNYSKYIYN
ncbi:MAG: hypothetical protein ACYTCN_11520, partial [Planctomycetota bacterium]